MRFCHLAVRLGASQPRFHLSTHEGCRILCLRQLCHCAQVLSPVTKSAVVDLGGAVNRSGCRCRIFRVLGHPSPKVWPTLEQHFHWADNTGNIRLRRPDAGSTPLHEVPCALLSISAPLCSAGQQSTSVAARAPETFCACLQHVRASAHGHALPPGCAAMDLLVHLLTYDPAQRCTAQAALRHPYFLEVLDHISSPHPAVVPGPDACCSKYVTSVPMCLPPHAQAAALGLQEPLPGPNAFRHKGQVTRYPRRARATDGATAEQKLPGAVRRQCVHHRAIDGSLPHVLGLLRLLQRAWHQLGRQTSPPAACSCPVVAGLTAACWRGHVTADMRAPAQSDGGSRLQL
jgi:hypothetical protein